MFQQNSDKQAHTLILHQLHANKLMTRMIERYISFTFWWSHKIDSGSWRCFCHYPITMLYILFNKRQCRDYNMYIFSSLILYYISYTQSRTHIPRKIAKPGGSLGQNNDRCSLFCTISMNMIINPIIIVQIHVPILILRIAIRDISYK